MARRSRLFSLSALAKAYQRNLKILVRATQPARPKSAVKVAAKAVVRAAAKSGRVPGRESEPASARAARGSAVDKGQWHAGIAPGPAGARRYHLFVPAGLALQSGESLPLLVMLHGCGQTGQGLAASSRMNRVATRERFLVLYPEQERMANAHGCWNWFEQRSGRADAEAATVLAAVDLVAARHPVDLARVAVAGLSAGASMAVWMAARHPERICAVAMHSGVGPGTAQSSATAMAAMQGRRAASLPEPAVPGTHRVGAAAQPGLPLPPLLVLHGDSDGVVSGRNGAATALLWSQALGAQPAPMRTVQRGQRYPMRLTEFKLRSRTVVALREVVGLGHAWSGGAARQAFSDPVGPDASALIWAFVARQFSKI